MKRLGLVVPLLAVVVIACPRDKQDRAASLPVDTTHVAAADSLAATPTPAPPGDLSGVKGSIPSAAPDTFKQRKLTPISAAQRSGGGSGGGAASGASEAPGPLLDAVQREQAFSRFCYSEFGQKADPSLRGNVAMVVTVGSGGITDARVSDSNWSGSAGNAVNRCLNDKAKRAWKLTPGAVSPGRYAVQLSFTGS